MTVPSFRSSSNRLANAAPTSRRQRAEIMTLPAPVGMNTMSPIASLGPQDCLYMYNFQPYEVGVRTRAGYTEWANAFSLATSPIRTIVPFNGNREDNFNDRLFALSDAGIYNISARGTNPTRVFDWATTGDVAGSAVYTHFEDDGGGHSLILTDELNGLHEYVEATGTWAAYLPGDVTGGPATTDVVFVTQHKNRLWLIEKDSAVAWYLPTGAKKGAATKFNFGANLREGGHLVGLYSWTVDGGDGVDDYLVAVSREGAVIVYRGDDPANASTWSLVGVWYIGRVPAGRRIGSQYGGQLFLMCEYGLVSINALLRGAGVDEAVLEATDKITRVVRERLLRTIDQDGWEIRILPEENLYIVNAPQGSEQTDISYVRNLTSNGWGLWRDIPMSTADVFNGSLYFADNAGSVWIMEGSLDGETLNGAVQGQPVRFSMLTSFQNGDNPAFKVGHHCRPYFLSNGLPAFDVQARYDFDLRENSGLIGVGATSDSLWDTALWDAALWEGGVLANQKTRGINGRGHFVAIALKGEVTTRATLTAIEIQYEPVGFL